MIHLGITLEQIEEQCIKMKKEKNIELVVIDYLQLIAGSEGRKNIIREQEIEEITLRLKQLSKKLNITIITTLTLSTISNIRENHKPKITDISESIVSKLVVEIADTIMLLYRDDYYNKDSVFKNIMQVGVAKNKGNKLGIVNLLFLDKYTKICNIERDYNTDKILIGNTRKKFKIWINRDCDLEPYFNYEKPIEDVFEDEQYVSILIQEAKFVWAGSNIDLELREDLEEFLSQYNDKEKCTNYEYLVKTWNKYNKIKVPLNIHKPNYKNLIELEYADNGILISEEELLGIETKEEFKNIKVQVGINETETKPHFHYKVKTGEKFSILFEKAEYLYPIPRQLTESEINTLIMYLNKVDESFYTKKRDTMWNHLKWAWNNIKQIEEENPEIKLYTKSNRQIKQDLPMPDYRKLNKEQYI